MFALLGLDPVDAAQLRGQALAYGTYHAVKRDLRPEVRRELLGRDVDSIRARTERVCAALNLQLPHAPPARGAPAVIRRSDT